MKFDKIICYPCALLEHWGCHHLVAEGECCCPESAVVGVQIRAQKLDEEVTDPKSTGRKRAVLVKPITEGMICEWSSLRYAGGGVNPIIGCTDSPATHIHHGPDKNTLNNNLENLHAVCSTCHRRWHVLNDPTYPEDIPGRTWVPVLEYKQHDSETTASEEEVVEYDAKWKGWDSK